MDKESLDFPSFDLNCFDSYIPDWATDNECSDAELIACLNKVEDTNKSRFASLKDEELVSIISNAQASGTKKTTKWVVKTFEGKPKHLTIIFKTKIFI